MSSIAQTIEARTKEKQTLLFVKMDIKIEKQKATMIANLEHTRDLGVITEVKFKSHKRAILGLGAEEATSYGGSIPT